MRILYFVSYNLVYLLVLFFLWDIDHDTGCNCNRKLGSDYLVRNVCVQHFSLTQKIKIHYPQPFTALMQRLRI